MSPEADDNAHAENHAEQEAEEHVPVLDTKTINDLPYELVLQILRYLRPPPLSFEASRSYATFYDALRVCHGWRIIGVEVLYGRSFQVWSSERWLVMNKVLKHFERRDLELQAREAAYRAGHPQAVLGGSGGSTGVGTNQ